VPKIYRQRIVDLLIAALAVFFCAGTVIVQLSPDNVAPVSAPAPFDSRLIYIRSVDQALAYIRAQPGPWDAKARADKADDFVRRRFYHSYSFFDPVENWLAYLAGYLWIDLRSPVIPDDILKHPEAACSQQVIVFDALARRLGLDAAVVAFDHHMAAAVKLDGQWQVYDADLKITPRSYPLSALLAGDPRIAAMYGRFGTSIGLSAQVARHSIRLLRVNANPAPRATLFHQLTAALSHWAWAFFATVALLRLALARPRRAAPAAQPALR
jgi:hypothetical protein